VTTHAHPADGHRSGLIRTLNDIAHVLASFDGAEERVLHVLALCRRQVPFDQAALLEVAPFGAPRLAVVPPLGGPERSELTETLLILYSGLVEEGVHGGGALSVPGRRHLAVPLVEQDTITGVLFVRRDAGTYDVRHLRVLSVVAANVAGYLTTLRERAIQTQRADDLERARLRVQLLYDISKLLTSFQSVESTVHEVVALVARTLRLHTAIFVVEAADSTRKIVWHAEGESESSLRAAEAHMRTAYDYLVRPGLDFEGIEAQVRQLPKRARRGPATSGARFVLLPLVVGHGSIFGALQIGCDQPLEEEDLDFVNAVVNQLAIAVDRQRIIDTRQAAAEAGERESRLLADASAALGSSLEYRDTLAELARFVVPVLADICIIDEETEEGSVERLEVRFADEAKQRDLASRIRAFAPQPGWNTPQSRVLASGKPLLLDAIDGPQLADVAHDEAHAATLRAAEISGMMVVPLIARGRILGALTFVTTDPGRRYAAHDLAIAQEIAHRAAIAMDNARLYEQSQRATRARDEMLAVVAHDLRNPLSAVLLSLDILLRAFAGDDRRKSARQLATIQRAANQMKRLISDLLDTASIEAGRLAIEQRPIAPAPLISQAVESLQPLAASKSLDLRLDLGAELPAVFADAARLQQVIANLLGNAIKFTPAGGTIAVRARPSGDAVVFSVSDTGAGIDEEELPHLFDRYWQARRTARLGTGLGLFIVKGIVEAHGGRLDVESKVAEGSTFSFSLPLAGPDARQPEAVELRKQELAAVGESTLLARELAERAGEEQLDCMLMVSRELRDLLTILDLHHESMQLDPRSSLTSLEHIRRMLAAIERLTTMVDFLISRAGRPADGTNPRHSPIGPDDSRRDDPNQRVVRSTAR
jgi:signal transduction histidine kinase